MTRVRTVANCDAHVAQQFAAFPDDYAPDSDGNQRWREADLANAHYRANKARLDARDAMERMKGEVL